MKQAGAVAEPLEAAMATGISSWSKYIKASGAL
jgi:hypothetical protein